MIFKTELSRGISLSKTGLVIFLTLLAFSESFSQFSNTIDAGPDITICAGSSSQLNAKIGSFNTANFTYHWLPSTGLSDPNIKNPVAFPSVTTTYTVTVTGPNTFAKSDEVTIDVISIPKPLVNTNSYTTFCAGENVRLTADVDDAALDYQWYKDDIAIASATFQTYTATDAGNYKVILSKEGCFSPSSDSITVSIGTSCVTKQSVPAKTLNPKVYNSTNGEFKAKPLYVYNRFGDSTLLENIVIPSNSVTAGIFRLHFYDDDNSTGIGFGDASLGLARRDVVTQVFKDVSRLLSPTGNSFGLSNAYPNLTVPYAEIDVRSGVININGLPQPNVLGAASQYYLESGKGITFGELWELIQTGFDPYDNIANTPFTPQNGYFHGQVQINFTYNWYTALNATSPAAGQYDLYTVTLHEVLHALGISSNFSSTGISIAAPGMYTFWDTYLTNGTIPGGSSLLNDPTNQFCYNVQFAGTASQIAAGCNTVYFNGKNLVNHVIYSPSPWETGSSLSHLNCSPVAGYLMNVSTAAQYVQRSPHLNEVKALCDLGYQITGQYGDGTYQTVTYANPCGNSLDGNGKNKIKIAGVNDFRPYNPSNIQSPFTVAAGGSLTINRASILDNDIGPNGTPQDLNLSMSCPEIVVGPGTLSSITTTGFVYNPPSWFYGQIVIRYRPVNQYGEKGNSTYIFITVNPQAPPPCAAVTSCNLLGCGGTMEGIPNDNFIVNFQNSVDWITGNVHPIAALFSGTNGGTIWPGTCTGSNWPIPLPEEGNHSVGLGAFSISSEGVTIPFSPGTTLVPGKTYRISFWAQSFEPQVCPSTFSVYLSDNPPCIPPGSWTSCGTFAPVLVKSFLINNTPYQWAQYFIDYLVPGGTAFDNLTIINNNANIGASTFRYGFLDNVIVEEVPIVSVTSTIPAVVCIGKSVSVTYNICLNKNSYASNPNPITLQASQGTGLSVNTSGGNFNASGQAVIPAGILTKAQPCTTLVLNLDVSSAAAAGLAITNTLNVSDGVCDQNPQQITDHITPVNCCSIVISAAGPTSFCNPGSVTLNVNSPQAGTYQWMRNGIPISGASLSSYPASASGDYTVIYSQPGTTCTSNVIRVFANNPIQITVTPSNPFICNGSSVILTAGGVAFYNWTPSTGLKISGPGGNKATASPSSTTIYTVNGFNPAPGCYLPATVTVTVIPTPVITASSASVCAGETQTLSVNGMPASSTYQWYLNGNLVATTTSSTYNTPTSLTPGNYNYTVAVTSGTTTCTSANFKFSVKAVLNIQVNPSNPVICAGQSVLLTATGAAQYNWTPATGLNFINNNPFFITNAKANASPATTTTYTVTGSVPGNAACPGTTNVTVTVNTPTPPIVPDVNSCGPGQVTMAVSNPVAGETYNWYTVPTGGSPVYTGNTYSPTISANTIYYVEAVNANNCVSTRTTVNATINGALGPETVIDGLFDSPPVNGNVVGWYDADNYPLTPLPYAGNVVNNQFGFVNNNYISTGNILTIGKTYTLSLDIVQFGYSLDIYQGVSYADIDHIFGTGHKTITFTATAQDLLLASLLLPIDVTTIIDNVSIKEVCSPAPIVADVNRCGSGQVTMTVTNPVAGDTYNWYTVATGGSPVNTGVSYSPTISANTTYYVEAVTAYNSVSTRTAVNATINGTLGPDLITNGDFSLPPDGSGDLVGWSLVNLNTDLSYTLSSIPYSGNIINGGFYFTSGYSDFISTPDIFTIGNTYTITYDITQAGYDVEPTQIINGTRNSISYDFSVGSYSHTFVATTENLIFFCQGYTIIDNVSIKEVCTPVMRMGAQSLTQTDMSEAFVYPNPNDGVFNISVPGKDRFDFVLYNSLGEEVLRESVVGENYLINQDNLANGIYNLLIKTNGKNHHIKIVVAK